MINTLNSNKPYFKKRLASAGINARLTNRIQEHIKTRISFCEGLIRLLKRHSSMIGAIITARIKNTIGLSVIIS